MIHKSKFVDIKFFSSINRDFFDKGFQCCKILVETKELEAKE